MMYDTEAISHLQARIEAAEEERNAAQAEVESLRAKLKEYEDFTAPIRQAYEPGSNTAQAVLDEALNSGDGSYKP
jgi:chromosome condensin MukBEF ATPase and DNA-binding subunit MukB